MQDISLHILDIVENAVRADAGTIHIEIAEDREKDRMTVTITDDGIGMDDETMGKVLDPFYTTKSGKRVGLGLSLFKQAAEETGGSLTLASKKGGGASISAVFVPSHPDMKPLGNILETIAIVLTGYPSLRILYDFTNGEATIHFDSSR